jgi:hypothetical protein
MAKTRVGVRNGGLIVPSSNIITDGLVLHLDAGNTSSYPGTGTDWFDLTSNNNDGVLINGPTFDSGNGGSISFDGVNDYVELNRSVDYDFNQNNSFTISGWFNINFATSNAAYLGKWGTNSNGSGSYLLWAGGGGNQKLRFSVGNNNSTAASTPTANYNIGVWNFFCGVYTSKSKLELFLNDTKVGETIYTGNINNPNNVNLRLSKADYGTSQFGGENGSVMLYNRALTEQEILQNYNATKGRFGL